MPYSYSKNTASPRQIVQSKLKSGLKDLTMFANNTFRKKILAFLVSKKR